MTARTGHDAPDPERQRLADDAARVAGANWKRWGPYLAGRQWATVREDYSADGSAWGYFPHDHARSRAYRWGEDGLLGWTDRECRLCFALALWNGRDPILKERLFGLTGPQGNHGEDVKEAYFHLDSTPTHSYARALYKYPQAEFPYAELVAENARRGRDQPEFELADTGVFDGGRYFDVGVEYAKGSPDDTLIRITATNRGPEHAELHLLPTLWFRNTWSWGRVHEGVSVRPSLRRSGVGVIAADHQTLGGFRLEVEPTREGAPPLLFTENETNFERLYGVPSAGAFVKDAFHAYVVEGQGGAVCPAGEGTKAAAHVRLALAPGESRVIRCRLRPQSATGEPFGDGFGRVFSTRQREAEAFYGSVIPGELSEAHWATARHAAAGLLWSKQFYHFVVADWLAGDPAHPPPPASRLGGRNADWKHVHCRDVLLMPDTWEYPWFAAWDLAFHCVAAARLDPQLAKDQLLLLMREWYMHPSGQLPAYEFAFGDVNPPVHAWACWRVYKITARRGERDRLFLARAFHKLLINFTWWVNRKDPEGRNLFAGGFLGLDNIGVFDRSRPLPAGGTLEQADGTAWMAFFCGTMLSMALELACEDPEYEDVASKFFEHFVAITDAMNTLGGTGLWDEEDGFYYDQLEVDGRATRLKVRSMVGIIPLFAAEVLETSQLERLPGFSKRMRWFLENRTDLARHISYLTPEGGSAEHPSHRLLAIPSRQRLERMLAYILDEREFLSPFGVRSLSRVHGERPYEVRVDGECYRVQYEPGEAQTAIFGGNSNWRGPVWFPLNYLLIETLERYYHFYGEGLTVEHPAGSGRRATLLQVAGDLRRRLAALFVPDATGRRPCDNEFARFAADPHWRGLPQFHEFFHGEDGRGLGASHQTGWTALVLPLICDGMPADGPRADAGAGAGAPQAAARTKLTRPRR
ncbi:MAG: glucosidase [Phycisphaerales bacterium]